MIKEIIVNLFFSMLWIIGFICVLIILGIISMEMDYRMTYGDKPYDPEAYIKSCEEGNIKDCYDAGHAYALKQDYVKAIESWTKACDNGFNIGCFALGTSYRDGVRGANKDITKAKELFKKVCDEEINDDKMKFKLGCRNYNELNNQ